MPQGDTPLMNVIKEGRADIFKLLLNGGADVSSVDKVWYYHNKFCLICICWHACIIISTFTLKDGLSPLLLAIKRKTKNFVAQLIESGANVNTPSSDVRVNPVSLFFLSVFRFYDHNRVRLRWSQLSNRVWLILWSYCLMVELILIERMRWK